jgi:hypothetical protein
VDNHEAGRCVTTADGEYVVDGGALNKLLATYQLDTRMLPGQVFDIVEKKLIKTLLDEIQTAKALTIHFVNLEAIPSGPYGDFSYAICGGLAELVDSLSQKKIMVTATIRDASSLPRNLISRIDKSLEGHTPPDSAVAGA